MHAALSHRVDAQSHRACAAAADYARCETSLAIMTTAVSHSHLGTVHWQTPYCAPGPRRARAAPGCSPSCPRSRRPALPAACSGTPQHRRHQLGSHSTQLQRQVGVPLTDALSDQTVLPVCPKALCAPTSMTCTVNPAANLTLLHNPQAFRGTRA